MIKACTSVLAVSIDNNFLMRDRLRKWLNADLQEVLIRGKNTDVPGRFLAVLSQLSNNKVTLAFMPSFSYYGSVPENIAKVVL